MPPNDSGGADEGTKKKKKRTRFRTPAQKKAAAERRAAAAALEQSPDSTQRTNASPSPDASSAVATKSTSPTPVTNSQVSGDSIAQTSSNNIEQEPKSKENSRPRKDQDAQKKSELEKKPKPEGIRRLSSQAEVFRPTVATSMPPSVAKPPGPVISPHDYSGGDGLTQYSPVAPYMPGQLFLGLGNQFNPALIQHLQSHVFDYQNAYSPTFIQQSAGLSYQNAQPGSPVAYPQYPPAAPYVNTDSGFPSTPLKIEPPRRLLTDPREPLNISPKLPPGWVRRFDQEKEKYLYINFHTQETQWEEPETAARKTVPASLPGAGNLAVLPQTPLALPGSDQGSASRQATGTENSKSMNKHKGGDVALGTEYITPAKFDSADLHHLVQSSAPSRHLTAACLDTATEKASAKSDQKEQTIDTNYIPNPMVTFLVDEVTVLTCQLCRKTAMTLSRPSCKVSDDRPMLLPCGHVAGAKCLLHWLATGRDGCPFCDFSLRHAKCGHVRAPLVLDRESILNVPKTLPEGGAFADYCRDCRLERLEVNEVMRVRALKARVIKARKVFEEDERPESEEALMNAIRELEELSLLNREKRMGHLCILW